MSCDGSSEAGQQQQTLYRHPVCSPWQECCHLSLVLTVVRALLQLVATAGCVKDGDAML
jgi:hypothetical protein